MPQLPSPPQKRNTKSALLNAAIEIFAEHGFTGGSVDKISTRAQSHDRMIYYYFQNKEGLFIAALEEIYRRYTEAESQLVHDLNNPRQSMIDATRFMLHYFRDHPEFVTLLNTENLFQGRHIKQSSRAKSFSSPAIQMLGRVLIHGQKLGVFRALITPRNLYLMVVSLAYFYQSNRHTLSSFLGEDLLADKTFAEWEAFAVETVLHAVCNTTPTTEF